MKKGDLVKLKEGITLYFYKIRIRSFGKEIIESFGGQDKQECLNLAKTVYPNYLSYEFISDEPNSILKG